MKPVDGLDRTGQFLCRMEGTSFKVIVENEEQVELSFTRLWDPSMEGKLVPLNIDKRCMLVQIDVVLLTFIGVGLFRFCFCFGRYIMLRGSSGFYSYAIYEHLEEWPAFNIDNTRIAFKLREDM